MQRRHEVRPDELGDEEPSRAEGDEGRGHGGHGPPEDETGQHAEREREERVRRDDDALDVEAARPDPSLERVEGSAPPHDDEARDSRRDDGADGEQRRLGEQPAPPAHALRPGEPVGAELELAGDQRRADEEARERGEHGHDSAWP